MIFCRCGTARSLPRWNENCDLAVIAPSALQLIIFTCCTCDVILSYSCYTFYILVMTYSRIAFDFVNPVVLGGKMVVFIYGTLWLKFSLCAVFDIDIQRYKI